MFRHEQSLPATLKRRIVLDVMSPQEFDIPARKCRWGVLWLFPTEILLKVYVVVKIKENNSRVKTIRFWNSFRSSSKNSKTWAYCLSSSETSVSVSVTQVTSSKICAKDPSSILPELDYAKQKVRYYKTILAHSLTVFFISSRISVFLKKTRLILFLQ